jgi:ABC-type branched-subunit amino acid transport system substrate-binding protein
VSGYLRLAREGWVSGIIGPWSPNACLAVAPVAEAVGVPVVSHCPDYRAVTPELVPGQPASHPRRFFFLSRPASLDSGFLLAGFAARALGLVSLAAVARADLPVSSQQAAGFELFAKGKGVRAVASVVTGADPQQIESAIQQARQAGAEGILLGLAVAPLLPSPSFPVVPGLVAVLLGDEWWPGARPAPAVARPTLAYGLAYDDPAYPEVASFASAYRREYGRGPGFHALAAVDDLALLLDAAWRSGSLQPHDVRDALEQTEGLPGLSGRITMDRSAHRPLPMPATVFRFDPSGPVAVREGYLP